MTFRYSMLCIFVTFLFACETKPAVDPDAPKTPEWEACIADLASYADCKIDEAGQINEQLVTRTTNLMKIKRNQSVVSEEKCTSVLAKLPADDDCVPKK